MKRKHFSYLFLFTLFFISCKESVTQKKEKKVENKQFKYTLAPPMAGNLYGVVELGAAGFNSFIVEIDKHSNWKLNHSEFGTSLLIEGMTNTMLVNQKLQEYLDGLSDFGLLSKDIHFVVSSGAIKEDLTKIIIKELKNLGYTVNSVTPEEEGKLALNAVLPDEFKSNSFVVDLGSGNTKISYLDADDEVVSVETHGAKYYQKGTDDKVVYNEVKNAVSEIPLGKRKYAFFIGGIPTKMANYISKNVIQYTVLNSNADSYNDIKGKKAASGLNIFRAIQDETKVAESIYFRDGNFAIGFLLDKIK